MIFSKKFTVFIFLLIIFLSSQYVLAAEPKDISNHWAQDYILNVLENEIMKLYSDATFRPDQPITRGEFALAIAREMKLLPVNTIYFKDLENYNGNNLINALAEANILKGYPDGTFKPDKHITRAETIQTMINALGLSDEKAKINLSDYEPFKDIPENHWALNNIRIAKKIELVSGDGENFYPNDHTTRAEAAKLISKLSQLSADTGYITDVYPTSNKISLNLLNGKRIVLDFDETTLIGRNNRIVTIDQIMKTDKVFIISDSGEKVKYIKAYGMITQEDLATEISTMTQGVLEPADVKELATGNIKILRPKLTTTIKDQLLNQGLSSDEVEAIMKTNWNKLEELSRTRLAEAIAIQSGLPLDITRSLLDGDWEKLKTYAQIELVQRIVQEVLNSDLMS